MTHRLSRSDIEHLRDQHTGTGYPKVCRTCPPLALHPCTVHQLTEAALASPAYAKEGTDAA